MGSTLSSSPSDRIKRLMLASLVLFFFVTCFHSDVHVSSHVTLHRAQMSHVPRKPSNLGNMSVHELFGKVQRWLINEKATPTSLCRKEFDTDSFRYNYVLKSETNADNGVVTVSTQAPSSSARTWWNSKQWEDSQQWRDWEQEEWQDEQ